MSWPEKNLEGNERAIPGKGLSKGESPEIEALKERVEKLEAELKKREFPEEKEKMVKREIKTYLREMQQTPSGAPPVATRDEAEELKQLPASQQVGALISLVFEKGLKNALLAANQLDNPAILDEFHDILIDRYYQELIEKKILKF